MDKTIQIPNSFSNLLNRLFGKNRYDGFTGHIKVNRWKEVLEKVFKSLQKHFEININDKSQLAELSKHLNLAHSLLKNEKNIEKLNIGIIKILFDLCFQLLGDQVNNTDKKLVNRRSHYKLNEKRTLIYHSNDEQKFWIIRSVAGRAKYLDKGLMGKRELEDLYFNRFKNNPGKFIDWFKREYPEIYLELF